MHMRFTILVMSGGHLVALLFTCRCYYNHTKTECQVTKLDIPKRINIASEENTTDPFNGPSLGTFRQGGIEFCGCSDVGMSHEFADFLHP